MKTPSLTTEKVLRVLEKQMAEILDFFGPSFQILEDYQALGDARLSVFRSDRLWVVVIEAIRYDSRGELSYFDDIWLYGNAIKFKSSRHTDASLRVFTTPQIWQTWNEDAEIWELKRERFSILWKGERLDFSPSREELAAAGVLLSEREWNSGVISDIQAMRYVCHALDHPFFASEDNLRHLIDSKFIKREYQHNEGQNWVHTAQGDFAEWPTNCDLKLFLQTRDWRHPAVDCGEDEISIREAFEPLAKAIATGDLSHWENQDTSRFNSHWSHWAESQAQIEILQKEGQVALAKEGKRFQKMLEKLSVTERDELITALKKMWQDHQQELQQYDQQQTALCLNHFSSSSLELDGQFYNLGPHLWGETED